jgi:hypothetical protein
MLCSANKLNLGNVNLFHNEHSSQKRLRAILMGRSTLDILQRTEQVDNAGGNDKSSSSSTTPLETKSMPHFLMRARKADHCDVADFKRTAED